MHDAEHENSVLQSLARRQSGTSLLRMDAAGDSQMMMIQRTMRSRRLQIRGELLLRIINVLFSTYFLVAETVRRRMVVSRLALAKTK